MGVTLRFARIATTGAPISGPGEPWRGIMNGVVVQGYFACSVYDELPLPPISKDCEYFLRRATAHPRQRSSAAKAYWPVLKGRFAGLPGAMPKGGFD